MTFLRIVIPLYDFVEHDFCPKTGIHFSGSCSSVAQSAIWHALAAVRWITLAPVKPCSAKAPFDG
jgi:hypothetical protein